MTDFKLRSHGFRLGSGSQVELHAIRGYLKTGFAHGTMFGGVSVEDGIGVVDVDEDFTGSGVGRELREQAVASGKGNMAHFASRFVSASGFQDLIVGPKSSVEKCDVARRGGFKPFAGDFRQRWAEEEGLAALLEAKRDDRFERGQAAAEFGAQVVRKAATQSDRRTDEGGRRRGIFAKAASQAASRQKTLPTDGRVGAMEDIEDAVFRLNDFLNGAGGKQEEGLEFAQVKQAHEGVDIGGIQENTGDGRASGVSWRRRELSRGENLRAQVGGGTKQEPDCPIR